jgi:precorrin-6B methylase 2
VEDNLEWYEIVNKNKRNNQTVIHCSEKEAYVNALAAQNTDFDIIVIDGNHRLSCAIEAMKMIKPDGIILLDNSDRLIEKECGKLFRDNGFIQIDFSGFGPINGYCWTTSIFLKSSKLFSENFLGPAPIGGLNN